MCKKPKTFFQILRSTKINLTRWRQDLKTKRPNDLPFGLSFFLQNVNRRFLFNFLKCLFFKFFYCFSSPLSYLCLSVEPCFPLSLPSFSFCFLLSNLSSIFYLLSSFFFLLSSLLFLLSSLFFPLYSLFFLLSSFFSLSTLLPFISSIFFFLLPSFSFSFLYSNLSDLSESKISFRFPNANAFFHSSDTLDKV